MTSMLPDGMKSLLSPRAVTPSLSSGQSDLPTDNSPESLELLRAVAEQERNARLVSWVNVEYEKLKNQRIQFERQWHINLAFYQGRQNVAPVTVPGQGFRLVAPKAPPWRVRMVVNKIRTAVRTECSKLTINKPMPVVIPATTEDEDFAASRVAEQILKSEFANEDHEATVRQWVWWGVVTGNAFLKQYWNPGETDERAYVTPPPDPMMMMQMQELGMPPIPPQPQPAQGKIVCEAVNPFHLFVPDLMEPEIEKQPFVIHSTTKTTNWVKTHFGFNATPDAKASNTLLENAVLSPVGAGQQGFDSVLVKEVWIKPGTHPDFPQGGLITVCSDKIVQLKEEWPLPFKEYPFYQYEGIPTGGFYRESVITDLLPIQREYNRTKSQAIEIKNMMGKPKLMAYRGSVNPRQISSEPGQAVLVTPGYQMPTVLPGIEVPRTLLEELDRLTSDFDDVSGQHEITRGNTPSQVTSGTAIAFLQEQDDTKLAYQIAGIERATAKLGRHFLKFAVNYWEDERLVKIVGRDGDFEAKVWKKSSMEGNTDVIVQSGSALPFSKAARQAMVTDLMAQGFIDPSIGMELLDLNGIDKVLEDFLIDKRQAQRENMKMAEADPMMIEQMMQPQPMTDPNTGQPVMDPMTGQPAMVPPQSPMSVNSWDNHEAHIHFHNQFRKTQQFELLPEPIKEAFELHVQTHQMAIVKPQMGVGGMVSPGEAAPLPDDGNGEEVMPEGEEGVMPEDSGPPVG